MNENRTQLPTREAFIAENGGRTKRSFYFDLGQLKVLGSAVGVAAGLAFVAALVAGLTPPIEGSYQAPTAKPLALALLGIGFVCSLLFFVGWRPVAPRRVRTRVACVVMQFVAVLLSISAFVCLMLPFSELYNGTGPVTAWAGENSDKAWHYASGVVWIPIGLLLGSLALAAVSRRWGRQLLVWAIITLSMFILMLYVVLVAGLRGYAA